MNKFQFRSVKTNFISIIFGKSSSLIINFLSITLAAKHLGVEDFGTFNYLLAIAGIISKFIDYGQSPIIFREISKDRSNDNLLNVSISFRLISFIIITVVTNITLIVFSASKLQYILLNLFMLNIIISSKFLNIRELLDLPFKRSFKMHISSMAALIDNILFLFAVLIMNYYDFGILFFAISYLLTNLPGFIIMWLLFNKEIKFKFDINYPQIKWLIIQSNPLFIFVIFSILFQQIEVILLNSLDNDFSVGIYSAALRLTAPLSIIPTSIVVSIFPLIVANIEKDFNKVKMMIKFSLKVLFILSYGISIIFLFQKEFFTELFFGKQYVLAAIPTSILLFSQIFLFYNFFALDFFTALNNQKINSHYSIFIFIIHLFFLLFMIPNYSTIGASVSKLLASGLGFLFILFNFYKLGIKANVLNLKLILWCLINLISFYLLSFTNLYLYIILGFPLFILEIFLFNVFEDAEKNIIKNLLYMKK